MKRSRERSLTTHAGSLPRPADLLEMVRALADGRPYDRDAYARRVKSAVGEIVRRQVELGVDVIDDGEMGKPSFVTYVIDRLSGFELSDKATELPWSGSKEYVSFPEFYAATVPQTPNERARCFACTGPIAYVGQALGTAHIDTVTAAPSCFGATGEIVPVP